ncbi:right origin-binding protein [hydrocarbon metagenome]|uniref:Right origin-binding protein n=1 Tax=hydrocarbon metagenome TaxID=938273 RepID=A0A0W8E186_9ZZZZ
MLRDEKAKVIDVAFDFVFASHEGFSRAFSKQFGISPKKYSNDPPPIQLFTPYSTRGYHLTFAEGVKEMSQKVKTNTVFVQVIERPARKVILKRGINAADYFKYCEEVGCEVWGMLSSIKEAMYEPIGMWLPKSMINSGT